MLHQLKGKTRAHAFTSRYDEKKNGYDKEIQAQIEKSIMLEIADKKWRDHFVNLARIKEGIHLNGYDGIDPLIVFQGEGFVLYQEMRREIELSCVKRLLNLNY